MKSKITLFFTILICFLLQCTVMHVISIGSITPNLILVLCISMGLMRGRKSGMWTGFFCGFLVDMFYGSVFGFYALIYMYALLPSGPGSVVIAKQYPDESISILSTESQSSSVFTEPSTLLDGLGAFGSTESQFNAPVSESSRTLSSIEENPSFPSSPVAHFIGTPEMGNPFYSQGDVEREDREAYLQQQRDLMYSETPFPYEDYQTNKFARNGFVLSDSIPAEQENLNAIRFSSYSPIGFPSI